MRLPALICALLVSFPLAGQGVELSSYIGGGYFSGDLSWNGTKDVITLNPDGTSSRVTDIVYQSTGADYENKLYTEMYFGAKWRGVGLETTLLTVIDPYTPFVYAPLQTNYEIGLSYRYKYIEFNASHFCTHSTEFFKIGGGFTKIGARVYIINK